MGTGNYVTTLSGRNQQSNLDKIDNWETTRKYLFDRISLYKAYSLLIHPSDLLPEKFQMQNIYLRKTKRFQTKKSLQVAKIRNMDSVTAAEWLQCLTSKLRCCSIFFSLKGFMFTLKNTKEEFYDLFWKTPGRKRRRRPTTWRPFLSSPPSTMNDILWSATSLGSVSSWSTTLWSAASNEVHHQL